MLKKICNICRNSKNIDEFSFKSKVKNTRNSYCKSCHKNYVKEHYSNNKQKYVSRARITNKKAIIRNREWLCLYKKDKPCVDCGIIYHPCAMDFDHITDDKIANVSRIMNNSNSIAAMEFEMSKCDLICSNCHRIRTYKRIKNGQMVELEDTSFSKSDA